jgi:hypothetical protein
VLVTFVEPFDEDSEAAELGRGLGNGVVTTESGMLAAGIDRDIQISDL